MDLPNGTLDFQDGVKGYLTLDNFKTLYDKCSKLIHSRNPFSTQNPDEAVQFLNSVVGWINKIIVLLNHHLIYLSLEDEFIAVQMHNKSTGLPHAVHFRRADQPHDP